MDELILSTRKAIAKDHIAHQRKNWEQTPSLYLTPWPLFLTAQPCLLFVHQPRGGLK